MSQQEEEERSVTSRISRLSVRSQVQMNAAQARADLAIAKAKKDFLRKKIELEKKEMENKAAREVLEAEAEIAMAEASAMIWDNESNWSDDHDSDNVLSNLPPIDSTTKTAEFIVRNTPNEESCVNNQSQPEENAKRVSTADPSPKPVCISQAGIADFMKELRKPTVDLLKFSEGPIEYKTFKRQFSARIEKYCDSLDERLNYLEQYTAGEAKKIVLGLAHLDAAVAYDAIWKEFDDRYGRTDVIVHEYITRALNWTAIKHDDPKTLDKFSIFLLECMHAVDSKKSDVLDYSENIRTIISKLPTSLHDRWRNVVYKHQEKGTTVKFKDVVNFVKMESKKANDPTYGKLVMKGEFKKPCHATPEKRAPKRTFATTSSCESAITKRPCIDCNSSEHSMDKCHQFTNKLLKEKYQFLRTNGLCFKCLKVGHRKMDCKVSVKCEICKRNGHHTLMHVNSNTSKDESSKASSNSKNITDSITKKETSAFGKDKGAGDIRTVLSVVPIKIMARNGSFIKTCAFIDNGSTSSWITNRLAEDLNATGKNMRIELATLNNETSTKTTRIKGLQATNVNEEIIMDLPPVYTVEKLPLSNGDIITKEEIYKWPYLNNIELELSKSDEYEIGILLGSNAPRLIEPLEVVPGVDNGPFAFRTVLGWVVNGPVDAGAEFPRRELVNRIEVKPEICEQLVNYFNNDFNEKSIDDEIEMSRNDKKFMRKVEDSAKLEHGHYTIGLPFKHDNIQLPDNKPMASQRFAHLDKRLKRDDELYKEYKDFMESIIQRKYCEKVPYEQLDNTENVWYLPHHAVRHPTKRKLRVVFDCAARYGGTSLNDKLLQGPNLTNNLVGTLIRFRQEEIAFMSDIESMFHQVRVPDVDSDFLRFLWYENSDRSNQITQYRMKVHLFGATSSPSCASYALRATANDHVLYYSKEAVDTILNNFYVDDCLKSVSSTSEAIALATEVTKLCAEGGFHLTKWISNDREFMNSIPKEERAKNLKDINLDIDKLPTDRALGVKWNTETDQFRFNINIKQKALTRRGILSAVSSIYDPLGFVAPVTLRAKGILQDLCKLKLDWDDIIPHDYQLKWNKWLDDVNALEDFSVNRCYKPANFGNITNAQLHTFCDASEIGYGTSTYLRIQNENNNIHCCFVMGKSRVTPLKKVTIPRLELTAATVAVRTDKLIKSELEIAIDSSTFWTDSLTVIKYIRNFTSRFKTFVANRLSLIQEATQVQQWRYVGTDENPADDASRGLTTTKLKGNSRWLNGPEFLWKSENAWPIIPLDCGNLNIMSENDPEVKSAKKTMATITHSDPLSKFVSYFSSWNKLKRATAWIIKVKQALHQKANGNFNEIHKRLTMDDVNEAEFSLIKHAQRRSYAEEVTTLTENKQVKLSSSIKRLDPFLENGILRVGGRLRNASLPHESKHQILIPNDSHIATLILNDIHEKLGHAGRNFVLSRLRENYWIVKSPSLVRRIISQCVTCKKLRGAVVEQKMSDLPEDRIMADHPVFTYVGCDFFGNFEVKRGRSIVKRYGVIFTCLTTRAIHIEVAQSLDTSSFINALRRFIARRGKPKLIRSDNGTNFVSAEKELKEEIAKWNYDAIERHLIQRNIEWKFNPPTGSHHGGCFERQIKTVRNILSGLLKEQVLDEENLSTLFCEVESIINNRPITKLSDDPSDLQALSPNQLILLKSDTVFPPGTFNKNDNYAKRRWRQVQYLADIFWKRWTKEYLPNLQERQKWTQLKDNLIIGDIVLIVDNNLHRNYWPLGKIIELIPDKHGLVRQVKVKTKNNELLRPISKLVKLLENDIDNS